MIAPVNRISEQALACMNAAVQDMQDKGYEKADVDLGDPSVVVMVEGGGEVPQHILEEIKQVTSHDAATRRKSIRQQLQDGDYIAIVELVDHEQLPDGTISSRMEFKFKDAAAAMKMAGISGGIAVTPEVWREIVETHPAALKFDDSCTTGVRFSLLLFSLLRHTEECLDASGIVFNHTAIPTDFDAENPTFSERDEMPGRSFRMLAECLSSNDSGPYIMFSLIHE